MAAETADLTDIIISPSLGRPFKAKTNHGAESTDGGVWCCITGAFLRVGDRVHPKPIHGLLTVFLSDTNSFSICLTSQGTVLKASLADHPLGVIHYLRQGFQFFLSGVQQVGFAELFGHDNHSILVGKQP
ncbi:hypothetical protein D3C85_960110 [compost metagenome]